MSTLLKSRHILIVVNPASGPSSFQRKLSHLEKKLHEYNLEYSLFFTEPSGNGKLKEHLESNPDVSEITVLGGDGTLNYVVNEVYPVPITLSILSGGTGNDSVKSLHGELNFEKQVEIALHGKIEEFDLGFCNGRTFVNGLGVGFDGQVVQEMSERKGRRGSHLDYLMTVLRTVAGFRERELQFSLDGRRMTRKILLMTVSNGTTFGGGFMINPFASSRDGKLDVCVLNEIRPLHRFWHLPKLKTGAHQRLKEAEFFKAARVRIEASDSLVAHLDGEFIGSPPFDITILPRALKLRVRS